MGTSLAEYVLGVALYIVFCNCFLSSLLPGLKVFLYEINPFFIDLQKANLIEYNKTIFWIKNIEDLPQAPTIFIANEFFDALPIKQYLKVKAKWFESALVTDPAFNFGPTKQIKNVSKSLFILQDPDIFGKPNRLSKKDLEKKSQIK